MNASDLSIDSVFGNAIEIGTPEERMAYLDAACAGNASLRAEVERLLQALEKAGTFMHRRSAVEVTKDKVPAAEQPGTLIGRYKLLEQVGEGGMGVVYVAEQTEPVRRRVALKIIKPGMDTKQVIARFEAERQALAMMDHPNIARVLDAGATEAGRPYFVMELVRGMPITDYCDKARLSPRQRLELFVDVCQAVQHAHQKGIIHRDLKPSNVMITLHDCTPVVKVIDFGVAKAVGQQLTDRTIYTALTQLVGTPLYMSPEQAEMSGLDVDTRSDVYSLGVLLYELLTGQTPFDKETLGKAGLDEMRRIIREDEPLRPSRRFSTLGAQAISTISQHRSLDERRLSKILCGELDWIVMKSLEKDRSRRYESASALATDIQRYLSDEPVLACPPTTMYRFQKFSRKHKPALATAAAIALCLLLGTTVSAWQAARATTAEGEAKAAATAEAQQRQRAEANEQQAVANAAAAQEKEQEAIQQRDEVKALADKLADKEQQLQRTLYAAHINLAQRAWDSGTVRRVNDLLDKHRPKPGETDLRGFEWHYLHKLCHPELLKFQGSTVAYSPDGKRLAIGTGKRISTGTNDSVKILDAQTNRELLSLQGRAMSVAFSPDSKRLAAAMRDDDNQGEATVKVWDAQTGQELHAFKGHNRRVWHVAFSPDGKRLASVGNGKTVIVRDSENGQEIFSIQGGGVIDRIAISPDGKRLATAGDGQVIVWDAQTGRELLTLKGIMKPTVAFSPDSKYLASASSNANQGEGTVKVWDAQSGEELLTFKGQKTTRGRDIVLVFSPDGKRLASALTNGAIKVWNAKTGDELFNFEGNTANSVEDLKFNPDGTRLALESYDGTVKVYDVSTKQQAPTFSGAGVRVRSVVFSPDGKWVAGITGDRTTEYVVKLWEVQTGQEVLSLKHPAGNRAFVVAISPDGKRLAAGFGTLDETKFFYVAGDVKVWDAQTGQEIVTFKGHTASVVSLAFSPDSTRLVSSSGLPGVAGQFEGQGPGEVKVWDAATGQESLTLQARTRFFYSVAYSPNGKRVATLSRDKLNVWDAQSGQELLSLPVQSSTPGSVAFSPDSKRLASTKHAGALGGEVKVFNSETGEELLALPNHNGWVSRIVFSPDGRRIALGGTTPELKLWDAQTGEELLSFDKIGSGGVAFSADGNRLVTAGAEGLKIFDATPLPEKP